MLKHNIKIACFNQGQYGDIVMGVIAAKQLKQFCPQSSLVLSVNKKYSNILPLFKHNKYFDEYVVWDGYDNWPTNEDRLIFEKFDKIFNPMPKHTQEDWYLHRHQTQELCLMHGLLEPTDLQIELENYFSHAIKNKKNICLALSGETRGNVKTLEDKFKKELCSLLKEKGFNLTQIGSSSEPQYCEEKISNFLLAAQKILESLVLITVDTAWAWIASGYQAQTIGLYGYEYYPHAITAKNWMPINPNAKYLEANRVSNIQIKDIIASVEELL